MKKIISLILITLSISINASITTDLEVQKSNGILKKIYKYEDIEHFFYIRRDPTQTKAKDFFIFFHGGRNNAIDFIENIAMYGDIIKNDDHFMIFQSYENNNFLEEKKLNMKMVKEIYNFFEKRSGYKNIYIVGYAEGATFAYDFICENNIYVSKFISVNGSFNTKCNLNNKNKTNIIHFNGEYMDYSYYKNDNYLNNYNEIEKKLLNLKNCTVRGENIIQGNQFDITFLKEKMLNCEIGDSLRLINMAGMGRTFPYTNNKILEDFEGNHLKNFIFFDFIKKR